MFRVATIFHDGPIPGAKPRRRKVALVIENAEILLDLIFEPVHEGAAQPLHDFRTDDIANLNARLLDKALLVFGRKRIHEPHVECIRFVNLGQQADAGQMAAQVGERIIILAVGGRAFIIEHGAVFGRLETGEDESRRAPCRRLPASGKD